MAHIIFDHLQLVYQKFLFYSQIQKTSAERIESVAYFFIIVICRRYFEFQKFQKWKGAKKLNITSTECNVLQT